MPIFHDIPTTHEGFLIQPSWDDPLRVTAPDLSLPRPPPERKASRTVSRSLCNTSWRAEERAKTSHTGHFFTGGREESQENISRYVFFKMFMKYYI